MLLFIHVPAENNTPHELRLDIYGAIGANGKPQSVFLEPGDLHEQHLHSGMTIRMGEVPAGTKLIARASQIARGR